MKQVINLAEEFQLIENARSKKYNSRQNKPNRNLDGENNSSNDDKKTSPSNSKEAKQLQICL